MHRLYTLYSISVDLFDAIAQHKTKIDDEFSFTLTRLQDAMMECIAAGECDDYPAGKLTYENGELRFVGVGIKKQYHIAARMAKAGLSPTLNDLFGMKKVLKDNVLENQSTMGNHLVRIPIDFPSISLPELISAMTTLFSVNHVTCKNNIRISVILKEKAAIQVTEHHHSELYPLTEEMLNDIRSVRFKHQIQARYGSVNHIPNTVVEESLVEKNTICNNVKDKVRAIKLKNLLRNLKSAKTPESAFNLVTAFIGKRTEASGVLIRDNTRCEYKFSYTPKDDVIVIMIIIETEEEELKTPLFNLVVNADRKNIRQVYSSVRAITSLFC